GRAACRRTGRSGPGWSRTSRKLLAERGHDVPGEPLHVPERHFVGHGADLEDGLDDAAAGAFDTLAQLLADRLGAADDGVAALLGLLPRRDQRDELALRVSGTELRLHRRVARGKHVFAGQPQAFLREIPEVRLELLARGRVGLAYVDHGRPADLWRRDVVAAVAGRVVTQ